MQQNSNDQRYSNGLAKLRSLKAMSNKETVVPVQPPNDRKISPEAELLAKCRNRALYELNDHQAKAEAFVTLSNRYRALGLNAPAEACKERARLESATTRGFQSVVRAYDKKLEDLGIRVLKHPAPGSLESAERHLECYKSNNKALEEHLFEVQKAEETLQKLAADLAKRPLTALETMQFGEAAHRQKELMRMAEKEALDAAHSYKSFRSEVQSAEKSHEALRRSPQSEVENGPDKSQSRMNKLAVGVVVCQTLKVLDHEL